jgi:Flp pilus assembly protein TadG
MLHSHLNSKLTAGPTRHRQRGIALPLVAVGLVAMLAIIGLALDASHALSNKTRLQNTVDAAALAAAKEYDGSADIALANAAAMSLFGLNADGAGNQELNTAFDANEISVVIQWSEDLDPFVSTGVGPYVRVIATNFSIDATLTAVIGVTNIDIRASAVAGPSPSINVACNVAPMVVCAKDPSDPDLFGFEPNTLEVLKSAAGDSSDIGPGNFQLVRIDCPGGDCIRDNMAGSYSGCLASGETVESEPGNTVGPSVQGLNTRFGAYTGPPQLETYPPDVVVGQPNPPLTYDDAADTVQQGGTTVDYQTIDYGFEQYASDVNNGIFDNPPPVGAYNRRVLALPISSCTGDASGQVTLDVLGFGCYFLLQQVQQQGNEAQIFGQFIEGCNAGGLPGPAPDAGPAPYRIQLYKDTGSADS